MKRTVILTVLFLVMSAAAGEPVMEARVYFEGRYDLDRLGDRLGELYVVAVDGDEMGNWLVVHATSDRLAEVAALGFRIEVAWTDVRDKFYAVTGVDPEDPDGGRDYGYYINYHECVDTLQWLAATYPDICSLFSLGQSFYGKDIWCLKISDNPHLEEDEPACFFDGAIHANEPVGTSTVIMFAEELLGGYGTDPVCTWVVDNRETFIAPILNPDGSIFNSDSGGAQASWRKNRHPFTGGIGVDLNRNFGYRWGYDNQGSSPDPQSWNYRGPSRFSEPEARAVRDFVLGHRFRTSVDIHMPGHWNLFPWCYDRVRSPEYPVLVGIAETLRTNNGYPADRTGQCSYVLYKCNGVMIDWQHTDSAGKFPSCSFLLETGDSFWAYWNDSAGLRHECELNIPNLFYLARAAGVWFSPYRAFVVDTAHGNGNRRLEPGETADVWCAVRNQAVHPVDSACAISTRLVSLHPDVRVVDSVKPFPTAGRLGLVHNAGNPFVVRADSAAPGGDTVVLRAEFSYADDGRRYGQAIEFRLVLGTPSGLDGGLTGRWADGRPRVSTFVRDVLLLPHSAFNTRHSSLSLLDITGRHVMDLAPGENDVRHVAPGVYFVVGEGSRGRGSKESSAKMVIQR